MNKGKVFSIFLWIALAVNYYSGFSIWINFFAVLLLGIHVVEFFVFFRKLKKAEDRLLIGFLKTLLFGIVHISSLK
jgi:uncharacterized protein YhhL (DUF1145 family)